MSEFFLGIDQGTGSTKAVLLDRTGQEVWNGAVPVELPKIDGAKFEQNSESLLRSVIDSFREASTNATKMQGRIVAWGLALQRSGITAWNATTGQIIQNMMTWADTRFKDEVDKLGSRVSRIVDLTGLPVLGNCAAPKIAYLQKHNRVPGVLVGTLDTYILQRLSHGNMTFTEDTMASRTSLYGLKKGNWDSELTRLFDVDERRLAKVVASIHPHLVFQNVPLMAILGDQQAALLGGRSAGGSPVLNLGTIAALVAETHDRVVQKPGLISGVMYSSSAGQKRPGFDREFFYYVEGNSPITGIGLMKAGNKRTLAELDKACNAAGAEGTGSTAG